MMYCVLNNGFLKKKNHIELLDDCTFKINNTKYSKDEELYKLVLHLLPLGLREHWNKYYSCFQE